MGQKEHWENVYETKAFDTVGWYQEKPETSLNLINEANINPSLPIVDIGGGAYFLVDNLLEKSYSDITVLDISQNAIQIAKERLGDKASNVEWIVEDIVEFKPKKRFVLWHDRAVFHFLTNPEDIQKYVKLVSSSVVDGGHFILGTFSTDGPKKCSGLDIVQYSEQAVNDLFSASFDVVKSFRIDHFTPSNFKQNFLFSHLVKK